MQITQDFIVVVIKALFSWPTIFLIILILFFKDIKKLLQLITNKGTSVKLPGNFEFSLNNLPTKQLHENQDEKKPLAIAKQTEEKVVEVKLPKKAEIKDNELIKNQKLAILGLFLQGVSFQLIAWLYMHKDGKPFSLSHLLKIDHIPIVYLKTHISSYCVHSMYEKEAIAAEFKTNYWNFKRYGFIEDVTTENVRIRQDKEILSLLDIVMDRLGHIENEQTKIQYFPNRPLLGSKNKIKSGKKK